MAGATLARVSGFFDRFPAFYRTGLASNPDCLNARHAVLVEPHRELIAGRRVLDVGSHDGRWSFAALQAGAGHVLGIEPRAELVAAAERTFRDYGAAPGTFRFLVGDVHAELGALKAETIEIVFLFGFFYHTIQHVALLSALRRLRPRAILIDTEVDATASDPIIRLREEDASDPLSAVSERGAEGRALVGLPSRAAVELMLRSLGFAIRWLDWTAAAGDNERLRDYRVGRRVSLVATPG